MPTFKDRADPAYTVSESHPVDLDIGAPASSHVPVDWFNAQVEKVADDDTTMLMVDVEAEFARRAMSNGHGAEPSRSERAALDRDTHTMTHVELDLLRQDYEAELTLTQANSQALRDAVAELEATQAAYAANGETARYEALERASADGGGVRGEAKAKTARARKPRKRRAAVKS